MHNFTAGPAALPLPVLEQVRDEITRLPGHGMSIVEMSHQSPVVQEMMHETVMRIRCLASISQEYEVLFWPGGARLQFALMPLNLMAPDGYAAYADTGVFSLAAIREAGAVGEVRVAASGRASGYRDIPAATEWTIDPGASYLHITSNNTAEGTQFPSWPAIAGVPLAVDATSDLFSRPLDLGGVGAVYAAAQKNLGVAGVTVLIIRKDLLERPRRAIPDVFNYVIHLKHRCHYSTPPVFAIWVMGLVMRWLEANGGLPAMERINRRKAACLYEEIDRSGFYRPVAARECRSLMNVTFRLADAGVDSLFVRQAADEGLAGLAGHPRAGGIRASLYNGLPQQSVEALVGFMREFERVHG